MRALGPGSVSSFLKIILDVVFAALWIVLGAMALALLAEAGDGSMRDALSILDQAIASTSDHLTLEAVRGLIGSAPATALETVMQAVAESSSEKILVLVDELIGEGHSPTHFARQMVRFLRNVTVAKIAGKDSPLLQISSDERARVAAGSARSAGTPPTTRRCTSGCRAPAGCCIPSTSGCSPSS